jgi:hypothetical protein
MSSIAKTISLIFGGLLLLVLAFEGTWSILAFVDRCHQHSSAESRSITSKVQKLIRANGASSVREATNRKPIFYCLTGNRADFDPVEAFASQINYRLPEHNFFCGALTYKARLLLFFENSVLDAKVPLGLRDLADESDAACFIDSTKEHKTYPPLLGWY